MHMIEISTSLKLEKILALKPFFFFYSPVAKKRIFSGGELLLAFSQRGDVLSIETNFPEKEALIERQIRECFGVDEDLTPFYQLVKHDKILGPHYEKIVNTTILSAFTPYEAVLGGIASQNTTFARYMQFMRVLDRVSFNHKLVTESFLQENGFGYKTRFILDLPSVPDIGNLDQYLGIGPYTVTLLDLFQTRNYRSFYCDVLIRKIVNENYRPVSTDGELLDFAKDTWGRWRGLMEVYLQKFVCDLV